MRNCQPFIWHNLTPYLYIFFSIDVSIKMNGISIEWNWKWMVVNGNGGGGKIRSRIIGGGGILDIKTLLDWMFYFGHRDLTLNSTYIHFHRAR